MIFKTDEITGGRFEQLIHFLNSKENELKSMSPCPMIAFITDIKPRQNADGKGVHSTWYIVTIELVEEVEIADGTGKTRKEYVPPDVLLKIYTIIYPPPSK